MSEEEIQKHFAEVLSKSLEISVFIINRDTVDRIVEIVKQLPEIEKKYSSDELHREVSDFVSGITVSRPKNEDEAKERLEAFVSSLVTEKRYEAIIILPNVIGLPIGTRIGPLEIIEQTTDDKLLDEHLAFLSENRRIYLDNRSYGKVEFKAYTSVNNRDVFYKKLELPFGILSLITDFDCDVKDCAGIIRSPDISKVMFLEPQNEIHGWSRYHAEGRAEYLETLSDISLDNKPNRLRQKVLQAIQVFGLSRLSRKPEIRFLLLISSFESLLLTENDRDYLGKKLSEKTAFLLESEYQKRIDLYRLMKKFYGQRSDLVHSGKSKISDMDVRNLENIFKAVVFRILELSKKYTKMEQMSHKKDKEGIEDYINELRFS